MAASAAAVRRFHTHAIPLDMEDIERDWDAPVDEAGIAAKASIIVRVGMLDLGAGTGSFRVREMMHRIAYPLGVHVRADVNLTDIEATCTDGRDRITEVVDLPTTGVNTERIWLLEHFADWFSVNLGMDSIYHARPVISEELVENLDSPEARKSAMKPVREAIAARARVRVHHPPRGEYAEHFDHVGRPSADSRVTPVMTVRQVHERLDLIERRRPLYAPWFSGLAGAVACAAFVFLLGGGPYDMVGAFVGAGLGQWLRRRLFAHRLNQFFVTFVCVAVAALACTGMLRLIGLADPIALQHDTAYIGAMLFVIPGFPLITGGLDIAKIDFPSGIQRLCYTLAIILMATLAGWMVASMVHLNPQGFEPLDLNPWVNAGLRLLAAFGGVWGFSVLFNSPQRMCFTAAVIGAITDTLRLTLTDMGMAAEAAAFIGAMLAGLLASAWRSSVRRGWLPPHLGYPRICLTVPSIVIMVPGLYMYQAMFHLGQFDTQEALDWAFRAFMVILCLPIGLAMARVLTDRSWRYDD
ncbi:threonine/serine exporter family protein [uncultured Bifidobacterium sp.]|uniref:threonine/serine ThrE exporter family protein n=1 Tax=uncultured Bifidobacterium sp. TaxID=165187 RepID=UPI0028DC78BA|nr:threonine/serine exporter family protein [uncultured Bifidobacterium sp.]